MPADAGADRSANRSADRLLAEAVRRAPGWSTAIVTAAVFGAAGSLLLPAALGDALDAALGGAVSPRVAVLRLGAVLAATVAAEVLTELADTAGAAHATARLRHGLIRRALALGPAGQRRFGAGDVTARLVTGAGAAGRVLPALLGAGSGIVTAVGALAALAWIDWRPAVTVLVGTPAAVLAIRLFVRRASASYTDYQHAQGEIAELLVGALAGVTTIRACGTVRAEIDRVLRPLPRLARAGRDLWRAQRRIAWSMALLVPLLQVAVLAVCGYRVAAGRMTPGELVAALGYLTLVLGAVEHVDGLLALAQARAGAHRVAELPAVAGPPANPTPRTRGRFRPEELPPHPGRDAALCLRAVTVRAGDGTVLLDRVDLDVPAGAVLAVVGRSGSGKTTLAALPGRLVEPDTGQVLLAGRPVDTMDDSDLRGAVAYAFERPTLLGDTVLDAIGYGGAAPSPTWVARAADLARADRFVRLLPDGYATPLIRAALSGGETQRLGLARALAQDAGLLVLDDATSNLDTATEAEVTDAITGPLAGHTRLVVAHRPATAAGADLVAWLDGGRVRAVAPHARLWRDPDYRAVFAAGTQEGP